MGPDSTKEWKYALVDKGERAQLTCKDGAWM